MGKLVYKTFLLNMLMQSTDVAVQLPPKSLYLNFIKIGLLKVAAKNINSLMPLDFFLNEALLGVLNLDECSPMLQGHEDDPLDEKQSNIVEIFVYIAICIF